MLTTWQEELWLNEQSQITELSKPFLLSETFHFPFPLQGSTPKSQSFFPILFPISFNAFTAIRKKKEDPSLKIISSLKEPYTKKKKHLKLEQNELRYSYPLEC